MKAEQANQLAETGIANLANALEQGKSETLTAYLAAMGKFHRYSFGNVMLIMTQKPDATRVAGFRTWKKLDRFVTKGEKGIVIIAPMMIQKNGDGTTANADDEKILRFKAAYVFDISQTEGNPLPEFARVEGDPSVYTERLAVAIEKRDITLIFARETDERIELGNADGASFGGRILVRDDLSPACIFSVLVHEFAHEMLHRDETRKALSKTVRETEAEAVAFVVSQAIGLDAGTAAADYIQLYAGDKDTFAESLDRIQKTARTIIEEITLEADEAEPGRRVA
jgi:antirestriction protein ArdC